MKNLKKLSPGNYEVTGYDISISKDYSQPQYDWIVTVKGEVCDTCLTLKEFKQNLNKYIEDYNQIEEGE